MNERFLDWTKGTACRPFFFRHSRTHCFERIVSSYTGIQTAGAGHKRGPLMGRRAKEAFLAAAALVFMCTAAAGTSAPKQGIVPGRIDGTRGLSGQPAVIAEPVPGAPLFFFAEKVLLVSQAVPEGTSSPETPAVDQNDETAPPPPEPLPAEPPEQQGQPSANPEPAPQ
jgi:hypothetical protein